MTPVARWTDDGLDRLAKQVDSISPVVTKVAVMEEKMTTLARALDNNTKATEHVAQQMEDAKMEPLTRSQNLRHQVYITIVGAVAGGVFVLLGVLLSKL